MSYIKKAAEKARGGAGLEPALIAALLHRRLAATSKHAANHASKDITKHTAKPCRSITLKLQRHLCL